VQLSRDAAITRTREQPLLEIEQLVS